MEPADSIRRLGFARWYERRLIEAHAWLVTGVGCLIVVAACVEVLNARGSLATFLLDVGIALAAVATGVYGFFRYQQVLTEAERIGAQATCPGCGVYARFRLVSALAARCRKCEREWRLIR